MKRTKAMPIGRRGFTLPEVLVAVFVFTLVLGGAVNLLISSVSVQRISLQNEGVLREESYLAEYIGRALRQGQKEFNQPPNNCFTTKGKGYNYELENSGTGIRFLSDSGICQQFFISGSALYEQKSTDATAANFGPQTALTSLNVTVQAFHFALSGENQIDYLQPRITMFLQVNGTQIQTTISQRNFDVQK